MSERVLRKQALAIFRAALAAANPAGAVARYLKRLNTTRYRNIYVLGAGKAGASMAQAAERVLGRRITGGLINVKNGHVARLRRIETEILRQHVRRIECGRPAVLALGGGAFAERPNREMLANNGITVWLDCPLEVAAQRVGQTSHRPLARDPEKFAALYESRREAYRLADVHVPILSDDPASAVEAILGDPLLQ